MWVFYILTDDSISLWLFPRSRVQELIGQFFKLKIWTKQILLSDFVVWNICSWYMKGPGLKHQVSGRSCDIEFDQVSQHTRVSSTLLLQSDLRCEAKTALIIYHLQPLPCFWSSRWQIARRINSSSDPGQLMVAIKCKSWLAIIFDFSASVCIYHYRTIFWQMVNKNNFWFQGCRVQGW